MSEDNKKQNEPEKMTDVKQVPGGARELSADELQKVAGGVHKPPPPPTVE
jgi:hypothetical protein